MTLKQLKYKLFASILESGILVRRRAGPVLSLACRQAHLCRPVKWWTGANSSAGARAPLGPAAVLVMHWSSTRGAQMAQDTAQDILWACRGHGRLAEGATAGVVTEDSSCTES